MAVLVLPDLHNVCAWKNISQSHRLVMSQISWAAGGRSEEEQEDLYILAGIDMANHSTDAARRNATVNLLPADGPGAGTFVLTAGDHATASTCARMPKSAVHVCL